MFSFSCHRRVDPAYERGASKFVREVAAASGGIDMIVCPCIDCCNIDRHCRSMVVDHLVTRGMEEAYKKRSDWYLHGELSSGLQMEAWQVNGMMRLLGYTELLSVLMKL